MAKDLSPYLWWQTGIIYQIYPRSFQDSNGDGIGDLNGIRSRLDYLKWLDVDVIWMSPIFPSPMADFGYDISDYKAIHPMFGTMGDFDALLKEVHENGMKLLLDFVPNHSSDQHPWFLESRSSRDNPKRDWYIWEDAAPDGGPPNNWLSVFAGSAWEWDEHTGQYYYHAFLKEQPDLNWRNLEVKKAMYDVMRFWLDKGVDGFRVDVMWHLIKDKLLRNNPPNPDYDPHTSSYNKLLPVYSTDQPEVHDIVHEMRAVLDSYDDHRIMIGELYLPIHKLMTYYGTDNNGAQLPFNFLLLSTPWDAVKVASAVSEYEAALPPEGWPNWVIGNHDQPRIISRIGVGQARVGAVLLLTLRGTPTMYYGDEIGMSDVPIPPDEVKDPQGLNMPNKNLSRDPSRTPMQWDDGPQAGFSDATPWLRVSRTYKRHNVAAEREDEHSFLSFYRRLIALRQREPSLEVGNYIPVHSDHQMLAFIRHAPGHPRFLIVVNFTHRPCYFRPKELSLNGRVEVATGREVESVRIEHSVNLAGDEAVIIRLDE
jgi:alpha-glucosidase